MRRVFPPAVFLAAILSAGAGVASVIGAAPERPARGLDASSPPAEAADSVAAPAPAAPTAGTVAPVTAADSQPAPDIVFADLQGTEHRLSEFHGHPVVLEFWASWCVPCRKGFPYLDRLAEKHQPSGLRIVAITLEDDSAAVEGFVSKVPVRFLVGRDPSGAAGESWEVAAMPTAFLLDAEGHRLARFEGGTDDVHRDMETAIEELLRGEPVTAGRDAPARDPRGAVRAWQRGYLADPIMSLDGDPLTRTQREHVHASKEAAAGDGGVAGGGCGCN